MIRQTEHQAEGFSTSEPQVVGIDDAAAGSAAKAFGSVKIPWLLMTGTKDLAPIGRADMKSRSAVYPALEAAEMFPRPG